MPTDLTEWTIIVVFFLIAFGLPIFITAMGALDRRPGYGVRTHLRHISQVS